MDPVEQREREQQQQPEPLEAADAGSGSANSLAQVAALPAAAAAAVPVAAAAPSTPPPPQSPLPSISPTLASTFNALVTIGNTSLNFVAFTRASLYSLAQTPTGSPASVPFERGTP